MMANPASVVVSLDKLEKEATALGLNKVHEEFFIENPQISEPSNYCGKLDGKKTGAKDLCIKAVHFLNEIAQKEGTENVQLCSYFPYWLYEEIGKIHVDHKANVNAISFIKELTDAVSSANREIYGYKCYASLYDYFTTLDDWKNRKFSYIYFNKYNDIKRDVTVSPDKDKCKKYSTYLDIFNSFYKIIEKKYCTNNSRFPLPVPKYFNCDKNLNPESLLSTAKECEAKVPGSDGGSVVSPILSLLGLGSLFSTISPGNGRDVEAQDSRNAADSTKDGGKAAETDALDSDDSKGLANSPGTGKEASSEKAVSLPGSGLGTEPSNHVVLTDPQHQAGREAIFQSGVVLNTVGQLPNENNGGLFADHGIVHTAVTGEILGSSIIFQKISEVLKSDYFRHSLTGASAVGVLIFLFYFFSSTPIGSKSNKRDKTKRERENNYYEAYVEDFSRYGSEDSVADSQMSDVHLSYQPRRDSYY